MAKVVCESCETIFQYDVVKDMKVCPVCGKPLWEEAIKDSENDDSPQEVPSFGEGIELGENDSFDEDKIDFWWYEIREPGADGASKGRVYTTCSKCNHLSFAPYPIARFKDFLLIDSRFHGTCSCGNGMKNHVLSKRPADWVDSRKRSMITDWQNVPKCPICSSTQIHKISMTNKAASAIAFGMLAAGHVSKTFKCDTCGAEF